MDDSEYWYTSPLLFAGAGFGTVIGLICLIKICCCCYKGTCSEAPQSSSAEPTQVNPSLPPAFTPTMASAPPAAPFEDPPPYSEIAFKPNIWPLVDQLPSYDNIAMENLPSPDMPHHPRSTPKDNF